MTAASALVQSAGPRWVRVTWRGTVPQEHSLLAVDPERRPAGAPTGLRLTGPERPEGWVVDVRCRGRDDAVVGIEVSPDVATPGLPLWFAEVPHGSGAVPTVSLLAFAGGGVPAGSLLRPHQVAFCGLRMADHIAEVRWQVRSGLVETVAVRPGARGRGIGRVLVTAADGLRALRDWAPLVGDGRLTDTGAAWLASCPPYWRPRLARRTAHLPAAPAPGGLTGVARLLR